MPRFDVTTADAIVRVDLGGEHSFDEIKDMVRAVCDNEQGTRFFETTETDGASESPVLGQHSYDAKQNLFVAPGPGMDRLSFDPAAKYAELLVVAHERAEWGTTVTAARVYPEGRAAAAAKLAGQLYRAFDKDINEFQASDQYRNRFMQQGSPLRAGPGGDGAKERPGRQAGGRPGSSLGL